MARLIRPRVLVPLAVVVAIAVAITFVAAREGGSAASRQLRAVSFPGYRLLSTTGNSYAGTTGVYGIYLGSSALGDPVSLIKAPGLLGISKGSPPGVNELPTDDFSVIGIGHYRNSCSMEVDEFRPTASGQDWGISSAEVGEAKAGVAHIIRIGISCGSG